MSYETRPNDPLFIDDKETPLTEGEATYALREAYKVVNGEYPSVDSLAILWAQTALETARWKKIHWYNWGNIKKLTGQKYTSFKCSEIIKGVNTWFVPYHPQTFFAAWDTSLLGAVAYINFLVSRSRYAGAWAQVKAGDPTQYCYELKKAGYFTADLGQYTKGVVSLTNEFKKKSTSLLAWMPPTPPPVISPDSQPPAPPPLVLPDLDYHPDQENPKDIPVSTGGWSFIGLIIQVLSSLFGK